MSDLSAVIRLSSTRELTSRGYCSFAYSNLLLVAGDTLMNIKITLRNGDTVTIPSRGESAESWLVNVRRSGQKYTPVGNTSYLTEDILNAVDEKPRKDCEACGENTRSQSSSSLCAVDFYSALSIKTHTSERTRLLVLSVRSMKSSAFTPGWSFASILSAFA